MVFKLVVYFVICHLLMFSEARDTLTVVANYMVLPSFPSKSDDEYTAEYHYIDGDMVDFSCFSPDVKKCTSIEINYTNFDTLLANFYKDLSISLPPDVRTGFRAKLQAEHNKKTINCSCMWKNYIKSSVIVTFHSKQNENTIDHTDSAVYETPLTLIIMILIGVILTGGILTGVIIVIYKKKKRTRHNEISKSNVEVEQTRSESPRHIYSKINEIPIQNEKNEQDQYDYAFSQIGQDNVYYAAANIISNDPSELPTQEQRRSQPAYSNLESMEVADFEENASSGYVDMRNNIYVHPNRLENKAQCKAIKIKNQ